MAASCNPKQFVQEVFIGSELGLDASRATLEASAETRRPALPGGARLLLGLALAGGAAVLAETALSWQSPDLIKFGAFLAVSLFSAGARVRVPGVTEPFSLSYLFVLLGLVELTAPETILLACGVAMVAVLLASAARPRASFALFQVALMIVAAGAAERVYPFRMVRIFRRRHILSGWPRPRWRLFLINTAPIAAWTAIDRRRSVRGGVAAHIVLVVAALPGGSRDRQSRQHAPRTM